MEKKTILVKNGIVIDGTGKPGHRADIRIRNGMIERISEELQPAEGEMLLPADRLCVCPGFIDAHCHTDFYAEHLPDACGKALQGVTTDVCGLCGDSAAPIGTGNLEELRRRREYRLPGTPPLPARSFGEYRQQIDRQGNATNMALFVGNSNLRIHAVGYENRHATAAEMSRMTGMLTESMQEGAFGLSTGLTYVPSMNSSTEELVALCRAMAPYGGIYNSHMRNESDCVMEAIREVITIAERSGCKGHISHLKVSGKRNHGKAGECLALIHEANARGVDVSYDVYPYTAGSCGLRTLLPPEILVRETVFTPTFLLAPDTLAMLRRRYEEADWDNLLLSCGGDGIVLSAGVSGLEGRSIGEIAAQWETDAAEAVARLLCRTEGQGTIIYHALAEKDLRTFLLDPLCSIGTEAFARSYTGPSAEGCPHPRNYGAFPRWVRRYLLDEGLLSIEEGVRRITSLPARQFDLKNRGLLQEGFCADLTIFDPKTIGERGDFLHPAQQPEGIKYVLVNGRLTVEDGVFLTEKNGRMLRMH